MFEDDERFKAVERPREREDLFENYLVELHKKVLIYLTLYLVTPFIMVVLTVRLEHSYDFFDTVFNSVCSFCFALFYPSTTLLKKLKK